MGFQWFSNQSKVDGRAEYLERGTFGSEGARRKPTVEKQKGGANLPYYAAKCALQAKEELQKYKYSRILLDLLSERGWSRDDKRDLLLFLERIVNLRNKDLERQYVEYRSQLSKEGKIMYIPLGERELAREIEMRGVAKGKAEGKEEMARNLLANGVSPDIIARSAGLPLEKIRSLMN